MFELYTNESDDWVKAWAIQLSLEDKQLSGTLAVELPQHAHNKSPVVRLFVASALQRLPVEQRWDILAVLVSHAEDAADHNLPLMYWYALEPVIASDPAKAAQLLKTTKIPLLREYTARRLTAASQTVAGGQQ